MGIFKIQRNLQRLLGFCENKWMSDKSWVYYPTGTYMYRARLAMYAHVQSKQVRLLPKGHVCIYIHKFHIFHSSNSSLGFNGLR